MNHNKFCNYIMSNANLKSLQERYKLTDEEVYCLFCKNFELNLPASLLEAKTTIIYSLGWTEKNQRMQATLMDVTKRGCDIELLSKATKIEKTLFNKMLDNPKELPAKLQYEIYVNAISSRFFLEELYAIIIKNGAANQEDITTNIHKDSSYLKKIDYTKAIQLDGGASFEEKFYAYFSKLPCVDERLQNRLEMFNYNQKVSLETMAKLCQLDVNFFTLFLKSAESVTYEYRIQIAILTVILETFFKI